MKKITVTFEPHVKVEGVESLSDKQLEDARREICRIQQVRMSNGNGCKRKKKSFKYFIKNLKKAVKRRFVKHCSPMRMTVYRQVEFDVRAAK